MGWRDNNALGFVEMVLCGRYVCDNVKCFLLKLVKELRVKTTIGRLGNNLSFILSMLLPSSIEMGESAGVYIVYCKN